MASKKYERPPLIEVRCEAVVTGGQWDDDTPFHLRAHLLERFPRQVTTPAGETRARLILSRWDDTQTVQFFPDKVIFSQLQPYPGFQSWSPSVLEMIELHKEVMRSARVERLGVRYVNRIALPDRHADLSRYLKVDATQTNGFRRQLALEPFNSGHKLFATVGSSHASAGPSAVALLDILDLVDAGDCGDLQELSRRLSEAHQNVETAFEMLVTEEARHTFGETTAPEVPPPIG